MDCLFRDGQRVFFSVRISPFQNKPAPVAGLFLKAFYHKRIAQQRFPCFVCRQQFYMVQPGPLSLPDDAECFLNRKEAIFKAHAEPLIQDKVFCGYNGYSGYSLQPQGFARNRFL